MARAEGHAALPAEEASFRDRTRSAVFAELDRGAPPLEGDRGNIGGARDIRHLSRAGDQP